MLTFLMARHMRLGLLGPATVTLEDRAGQLPPRGRASVPVSVSSYCGSPGPWCVHGVGAVTIPSKPSSHPTAPGLLCKSRTFKPGRSGEPAHGIEAVRGDRTSSADLKKLATHGPWDAVVDTSSSLVPQCVLTGAEVLEPVAGRYAYVSTVNAYRGWPDEPLSEESELLDAPPTADEDFGHVSLAISRAVVLYLRANTA